MGWKSSTLSILALVLLATSAHADPVITRSRVKLSRRGEVKARIVGRLTDADWGSVGAVAVRFGSGYEGRPLTDFRYSSKKRRYSFRDRHGETLVKARFDLRRGKFKLKVRSRRAEDYAEPLELMLRTSAGWTFELPVRPEKRKSRFRGELAPRSAPEPFAVAGDHSGWKRADCASCHSRPVEGHVATFATDCVACHGANGAPSPNRNLNGRYHRATDRCTECHGRRHDFTTRSTCLTCHYAPHGVDRESYYGEPPPEPDPFYLDWPEVDFSPGQYVDPELGIDAGDEAPDFVLRSTSGTEVRLSELLEEKPVLLILGAFT